MAVVHCKFEDADFPETDFFPDDDGNLVHNRIPEHLTNGDLTSSTMKVRGVDDHPAAPGSERTG